MQSYETKTFGKLSGQSISLQALNGHNLLGLTVYAALVKGLRRIPFTDESRVRFPYAVLLSIFRQNANDSCPSLLSWDGFLFMSYVIRRYSIRLLRFISVVFDLNNIGDENRLHVCPILFDHITKTKNPLTVKDQRIIICRFLKKPLKYRVRESNP